MGAGDHSIDTARVRELLDGRYADIRNRARAALRRHASILVDARTLDRDAYRDRVLQVVRGLTDAGVTTLGLPAAYGGGGDLGASVAAFETLAFGDLSVLVKQGVQFGLFAGGVLQLGTSRHHRAHLADIAAGRLLGCFAMTETGHGSDVQGLETIATFCAGDGEFELHTPHRLARKDYIGSAARHGQLAIVFAQLCVGADGSSRGVHAFLVPLRDPDGATLPGISITDDGPKIGLNGVDNGRIGFDHLRVPREALLDRYATVTERGEYRSPIDDPDRRFFTMLGTLVQGRVSVAGAAISTAKVALTIAVSYGLRRRQFSGGQGEILLLDHRMHRRRLLPLLARTYALDAAQQVLVHDLDAVLSGSVRDPDRAPADTAPGADRRRRALESRAAGTKALASWHAVRTIGECREACGGAGYLSENRFDALRADTDVFTTFEGDNHVLLQLVAKGLLTDHIGAFDDPDPLGTVRWVAGQAVEAIIERTAVHQLVERIRDIFAGNDRWDADAGIRDPEYQLAMLRWREEHQLTAVVRRIKHWSGQGLSHAGVFDRVQPHLISCGRSHVERLVLEASVARQRAMPDGAEKEALNLVGDLHALSALEADRAWWLEHGRLSAERSKEITRTVDLLCDEIRPLAAPLVEAFGVPREFWDVPMLDQRSG